MKADNKIVFMDGQYPSIIFPVGKPEDGGSCAFMTDNCFEYCPAKTMNIHEQRALQFFQDNPSEVTTQKIIDELSELSILHLYWWSWGDCLPGMEDKVLDIMSMLLDRGVLQNGFTRNYRLFERIWLSKFGFRVRIGYHAETVEEAIRISENLYPLLTCCPDVNRGKGVLYQEGRVVTECCGMWCEWFPEKDIRIADCQECYLYRKGCFV